MIQTLILRSLVTEERTEHDRQHAHDGDDLAEQDDRPGYVRKEDEANRHDRHWNELLQELRLAQTGTQILFAFLLTIAFTVPFRDAGDFEHRVFTATIIVTALATGLLLAPVSFHRMTFQQRLRDQMVPIAGKMAAGGLFLLMLAVCSSLLLALDTVLPRPAAIGICGATLLWFVIFWYVVPGIVRSRR